ncbi:hypothetical protein FIM02_00380 [SAR202 cluster bacterium AD-802-E10_MRT_200m]|nr:hypothetical protein [SAR202 cluster bacterium AD-802-E10_MRT_200m]
MVRCAPFLEKISQDLDARAAGKAMVVLVVFLILLFAPLPENLSWEGQRVLAVVGLAVTIWITDLLSPAQTGILAIVLLVLFGGVSDIDTAVSGFGSPVAYFLIGILGLGIGVTKSGLAERVASMLIGWAKGNPTLLFIQMLVSFIPITVILPSATTRNAIQIPVYDRILEEWQVAFTHPFGRAVTQGLGSLNRLASTALLAGGTSPVVAAALVGDMNWSRWFVFLGVPFYTLLAIGGVALFLWYRKGFNITPGRLFEPVSKPWTGPEKRATAIALLTAGLWFTDSWHGLHPAVPALTALVLLLTPRIGVLTWTEFERGMDWGAFIVLATSLSLANAMVASGVAHWLADGINLLANPVSQSPIAVLVSLMLVCGIIRLFIPSIVGYLAFTIPVAMSLAEVLGYNPLIFGLAALIVGDSAVFYPAAGTSAVLVYAKGNVSGPEIFRFAGFMMLASFVVILMIALPWWSLVGEPLVK